MQTFQCDNVNELRAIISEMPPASLYRGQTREYIRQDGGPDIRTSFSRHGCIPKYMLKWQYYAKTMLQSFVRSFDISDDLATDQAILQHYGWRSFFLDTTSRVEVAAWFAAHEYQEEVIVDLAEDCWEDPALIRRTRAQYVSIEGQAIIYVLSRKELRRQNIGIVDLVEISTQQGRQRCSAQSAFMVGPLSHRLPESCIFAKIEAPTFVFREYAGLFQNISEASLFPSSADDPFLATLLRLPLEKLPLPDSEINIDAFSRGLPLPEYAPEFSKIWHPNNAFYRTFWLADSAKPGTRFGDTVFYLTSESLFHGGTNNERSFPQLTALLKEKVSVAVEIDGLSMSPIAAESCQYGKGVYLEYQESGDILLCELSIDYPGGRPAGFGICRGYYYRPNVDGQWQRVYNSEECDCGYEPIHKHHLVVVEHFEDLLCRKKFRKYKTRVFITDDVNPTTDYFLKDFTSLDS